MRYRENGMKYINNCMWEKKVQEPYNYNRNGLLQHIMSKNISQSNNIVLNKLLYYYEQSIIHLLKYVDRFKHFKDYHWSNR
jgi:hypothetical protein